MIEHVFVVMLENRGFDHLPGFSQIQGTDPSGSPTKLEGLTGEESSPSSSGDAGARARELFKLGSLTKRDKAAQTLNQLFKLDTPRADAPPTLPDLAVSGYARKENPSNLVSSLLAELISALSSLFRPKPVDPSLRGFHHVALQRDLQVSPETQREEIARRFLRHKAFDATKYMERIRQKTAAKKPDG